jgi:hypothetical protein
MVFETQTIRNAKIFCCAFVAIISIKGLALFIIEPYPFYKYQLKAINTITKQNKKAIIYCNSLETQEHTEFMLNFKNDIVNVCQIDSIKTINEKQDNYFLLNCASNTALANTLHQNILHKTPKLFYTKFGAAVYLYKINNANDLKEIGLMDKIGGTNLYNSLLS